MEFPSNPEIGDKVYNDVALLEYTWNGELWEVCDYTPAPHSILWASGRRGIGADQNNNINDHATHPILIDIGLPTMYYSVMVVGATANGKVTYSTSTGNEWFEAQPPQLNSGAPVDTAATRVSISDSDRIIVGFQTGHWAKSDDRGETWTAIPRLVESDFKMIQAFGTTWVICHNDTTAFRSEDDGETWTPLPDGLIGDAGWGVKWFQCAEANGDHWIAGGAVGYAAVSYDDAKTWTWLEPKGLNSGNASKAIYDISYLGNDIWVNVQHNGYSSRSVDNGLTWEPMPLHLNSGSEVASQGNIFSVATDGVGRVVAVLDDAFAAMSKDYAETWEPLSQGLNSLNTVSDWYTVTYCNNIWYATAAGGFFSRCIPLLFPTKIPAP